VQFGVNDYRQSWSASVRRVTRTPPEGPPPRRKSTKRAAVSLATSTNSSGVATVVFAQTPQEFPVKPFVAQSSPLQPSRLLPSPLQPWRLTISAMGRAQDNCRKALEYWRWIGPPAALIRLLNEPPLSRGALLIRSAEGSEPAVPQRNSIRAREPVVLRLPTLHGVGQPRPGRRRARRVSYAPDDM
jgi:hypothetical protein